MAPFRPFAARLLTGGMFLGCVLAYGQDVTVGDPVWLLPTPAPEVLPKSKGRLRPDYPAEMRKTGEVGYVIVTRYLDPKGKSVSLAPAGTHVPFQRAVEEAAQGWAMSPAMQDGKGVDARVWVPVIFNPKSAATEGPEATPRLLAVAPVFTPVRPTRAGLPPVVRMKLAIDATGALTHAEPEQSTDPKALTAIHAALEQWRFAPARQGGQPVAAEFTVSVLCQPPPKADAGDFKPPRITHRETPVYPRALRRFGLGGSVTLDFEVDPAGRVRNAIVRESNNPLFDEPAITALRKWTFEPATRNGQPVAARQRVPIVFQLPGGGDVPFRIEVRKDQSGLPPELRYDTPPKIRNVRLPVYPHALRVAHVRGTAKATMLISPQGRIAAVRITEAARPEFGAALAAALQEFRFDPALNAGRPVAHLLAFEQHFSDVELPDDPGDECLTLEEKHPERIVSASALDAPLKPLSRQAPAFPVTVPPEVTTGEAVIECLVDRDGRVRLPRIASASDEAFGYAAIQAASTWWFEPPLAGGKAVVVRVKIPFTFKPATKPATPEKS